MRPNSVRRTIGNVFLAAGLIILLGVAGYFGWTQLQAAGLRAELRAAPPANPVASTLAAPEPAALLPTAVGSPVPTSTVAPTATSVPATAAHGPAPTAASEPAASAPPGPAPTEPRQGAQQPTAPPPVPTLPPAPTATPAVPAARPVRLMIPDLKVDTKVVSMGWEVVQTPDGPRSEWVIPKYEAGHHINSALLGEPGNLVISGHNNIYGQVFKPISFAWDNDRRIKVDDFTDRSDVLNGRIIQLFDEAGRAYTYVIEEFYRLRDTGVPLQQRIANGRFMQPTQDTRLTLITCWPPTNNTHRLVVVARPVE